MSEHEGGNSKFVTGFLVGFLVAVLNCLGFGGIFAVMYLDYERIQAGAALVPAEVARESAELERARAEEELALAEKALKEMQDRDR